MLTGDAQDLRGKDEAIENRQFGGACGYDPVMSQSADVLPVVVYDGACRFCRAQIARIQRWGGAGRFEFVPSSTPGLFERFPTLQASDLSTGLRLVQGGQVSVGAEAVYRIARVLPRTRWFAWLYRVPGLHGLAQRLYGWVAARRYRLAGRCDEGCAR
jgi:predicted DCC family thiol-disulfide oxidoreductase YuxK